MTFVGPIATGVVDVTARLDSAQVEGEANRAVQRIDKVFKEGMTGGANKTNAAFARLGTGVRTQVANIQAGFTTLGQVISSRLPAQVTRAAATISARLGGAVGSVRASMAQLQSVGNSAFGAISAAAGAAAIAVGVLLGVAVKLVTSFARIADETQTAEVGTRALATAMGISSQETTTLITDMRELGSTLGVSSNELITASQRFVSMGVSIRETSSLLEAITVGAARNNATSAQLSRTLAGLQQVQAKGVLSQEEFRRQILENIPGLVNQARVFELIAEKMGVTTSEARKLQEQGQVTASVALPAIQQAVEELNEGVDVLALRMSTLSGATAILRENFNQIVGTAFKPFIDALLPTIKVFIDSLKGGAGPLAGMREQIGRLGKIAGEAFGEILSIIVPLIVKWFPTFVTAIEAVTPVIIELVRTIASISGFLQPVVNVVISFVNILLTKLGPFSELLQQILAGLLAGGVIKALGLFGRAMGSAGGFIGRIATPLSKFLAMLVPLAGRVARLVTTFGILRTPIEAFINLIQSAVDKIGDLIGAVSRLPGFRLLGNVVGSVAGKIGDFVSGLNDAEESLDAVGSTAKTTGPELKVYDNVLSDLNETLSAAIDKQEELKDAQKAVADAQRGLVEAQQDLVDAHKAVADAQDDLVESQEELVEAQNELIDIDRELADAWAERAEVAADVARDIREIAAADRDLERINMRLVDTEQERLDILEKIEELSAPASAEELARADIKVARAVRDLNEARQEELDLLNELNQSQESAVDLSGLTLDQLRTRLAGMRSQAAAQNAVARTTRSEEEILEDLAEVRLDIREGELALNEALTEREELNNRALGNAEEIRDLTEDLRRLELDRLDLLDDQAEAIKELDALRSGETTRAKELVAIDKEIERLTQSRKDAVKQIETAVENIRADEEAIRVAIDAIKPAEQAIRDANNEIRDAKWEQRRAIAEALDDEKSLNAVLLERIGHNSTLIGQAGQLVLQSLMQNPAFLDATLARFHEAAGFGVQGLPLDASQLANLILNNPNKLLDLLRRYVGGLAEGGLITHPMLATVGEGSKHELMLPLSKPDRVWQLMSQNLPKYPGALRAAQQALGGSDIGPLPKVVSSGNRMIRREDGPATYGQIQELITLLREKNFEHHVEAPINITTQQIDEDLLTKKISRKLERELLNKLRR